MGIQHILKTVQYSDSVVVVNDELLKKMQGSLLEMMKDVAGVCKQHDIQWFLSGGKIGRAHV